MNDQPRPKAHSPKDRGSNAHKKRTYAPPQLNTVGLISLSRHIRYLRVILVSKISIKRHIKTTAFKTAKSATAWARLMPNIGGPCQWRRKLLGTVVHSHSWQILLWIPSRTRVNLIRHQKTVALKVISAYRTVSDEAPLLLDDMPPAYLLVFTSVSDTRKLYHRL